MPSSRVRSQTRRPQPRATLAGLLLGLVTVVALAGPVRAQHATAPAAGGLPPGIEVEWQDTLRQTDDGVEFTGPVSILWRETRIQADRLTIRDRRHLEAVGNVLIVWGSARLFGSRMTYDLETERGTIDDAVGEVLGQYLFTAERVDKLDAERIRLHTALVTTCTQPLPYWSFRLSSATIRIDHYARMWNVRLRAGRVPMVYLPLLVWPVKDGRSAGLLMPEFHTTQNRGRVVTQELFIPLGRSADLTLLGRYYTEAGFGGGGSLRVVPNRNGSAVLRGFYIDDKVDGRGRYRASYEQTQQFLNGFRMVADIELVSDFDYYADFERDLDIVSRPSIVARLEFSRNGRWTSLNVRELRREQLFGDDSRLVQRTLPEIEWRGRSRRLGRSPVYVAFESSLASIQQRSSADARLDADYWRADVEPELSLPWSPTAWLDVTPTASYRWTGWSQRRREAADGTLVTEDRELSRGLLSYGVDIVGPKMSRIYDLAGGSRLKHSIEPRLSYGFDDSFRRADDVLLFDEVDRFDGSGERMSWALTQRLFARRPRAAPDAAAAGGDAIVLPDGTLDQPPAPAAGRPAAPRAPAADAPQEPVEIASFELSQFRSFDEDVSRADLDLDGATDALSPYSPISVVGRLNPSRRVSLDVRAGYDILWDRFSDVSLSGSVANRLARLRFSLVHRNGLGVSAQTSVDAGGTTVTELVPNDDSTQVQLNTGLTLLDGRMQLLLRSSYDANPATGNHFPDQRWRVEYATQCCTFMLERLSREFVGIDDRRDLRLRIDLTGVGKIFDRDF